MTLNLISRFVAAIQGNSNRGLLGRIARLPLNAIPDSALVRILVGPLRGAIWIRGAATHKCWLGIYEFRKARAFARSVNPGNIVFDIGANVGFYTILAARLVGCDGEVVAFEPLPRNIKFLRQHTRLNHLENVTVVGAAVAEVAGATRFSESTSFLQGYLDSQGELEVEAIAIDSFVAARGRPPDVMKIDVEGGELAVLRGAERVLKSARPTIFLATHEEKLHAKCCSYLDRLGYEVIPLDSKTVNSAREVVGVFRR